MIAIQKSEGLYDLATGVLLDDSVAAPPAPVNTVAPSLTPVQAQGVPVGTLLTIEQGSWQGNPAPTFSYRWLRGGVAITGATATTYRTTAADVDKVLRGEVTATSGNGAASAATTVLTSNTVKPTAGTGGSFSQIDAISADTFVAGYSVRLFPGRDSPNVYSQIADTTAGKAWITDLAPGAVTHLVTPGWQAAARNVTTYLGGQGIKSVLTVGEPHTPLNSAQWDDVMDEIAGVGDHLLMVNGWNEINHARSPKVLPANWLSITVAHQQALWTRMQTLNATRQAQGKSRILVGSPNLWSGDIPQHHADLLTVAPQVRNLCDVACYHLYPRGLHPDWKLDEFITQYRAAAAYGPGKALWCTEGGYFDSANYTGGAATVTKPTKAIYQEKQLLEYAKRGVPISYFEFLDDLDAGDSNREASLGMVEVQGTYLTSGWSAKPSYTAMVAMLAPRGGQAGPVPCNLTIPTGVRWLAVTDSTGTTLYLWRPDAIEANRAPVTLNPLTRPVTVESPNRPLTTYDIAKTVVKVRI